MNKEDLIYSIAEKTGMTKKDSTMALNAVLAVIEESLAKNDNIRLSGFGSFETKERKARQGRNPRKPEEIIEVPAAKAPVFKAGKALKTKLNE